MIRSGSFARYERLIENTLIDPAFRKPTVFMYGQITSVLHISSHYYLFLFKECILCEWMMSTKKREETRKKEPDMFFHVITEASIQKEMAYSYSGSDEEEQEIRGLKYVMRNDNYVVLEVWQEQSQYENEEAGRTVSYVKSINQWYP